MAKYTVAKRHYFKGDKDIISIRIPNELKHRLEDIADDKGRTLSDIILTVLDQFAYEESNVKKE